MTEGVAYFRSAVAGLFILAGLLLASCTPENLVSKDAAPDSDHPVVGIDVSKYQRVVDFEKVKAAGISYVFVRATEGITYQDADFESNYRQARLAGLVVGAYHFYETNDEPGEQLENFTSVAQLKPGDLPPVIDIEKLHHQDDLDLVESLKTFLRGLEIHYGVKPIVYSGLNFANRYMTGFGDYPLWLAEYEVAEPTLPHGWTDWTFWQWSQTAKVAGISGKVDADRYNGTALGFRKLLIKDRPID